MEQAKNTSPNPPSKTTSPNFFARLLQSIRRIFRRLWQSLKSFKKRLLTGIAKFFIPRLEPYYTSPLNQPEPSSLESTANSATNSSFNQASQPIPQPDLPQPTFTAQEKPEIFEVEPFTPSSIIEFLNVIKRTPYSILSQQERNVIASAMNFSRTTVADIMLPPSEITYVHDNELIGPLTLDRLYRSGYQHFPVIDSHNKIIGILHTTALSSLEIKESSRADEILDRKVYYIRADYNLNQALAAFLRTNCYFFLVIDRSERIVGLLTYQTIMEYLFGRTPSDDFDRDHDRLAVAKRKL